MQELRNQSGGLKKKNRAKDKSVKNTQGLLKTEWHQGSPFDIYCGIYSGEIHNSVGCTPLAIAQLTKYYNYPPVGLESISGNTYDWSNMLAYGNLMTDSVTIKPVARLCKDAGIVTNANYGYPNTTASFSTVSPALNSKFNYTAQSASWASYYPSLDVWIDSLKSSISRYQPIIYAGKYNNNDHTWIIDDYDSSNNIFHFNQGQENTLLNDWYPTSAILTADAAVFNIKPDHPDSALAMPYFEDFEKVNLRGYNQIPVNTGVSNPSVFNVESITGNKALCTDYSTNLDWDYFLIKKIDLNCQSAESAPVLMFDFKTLSEIDMQGGDEVWVEVSYNNRLSWDIISVIAHDSYNPSYDLHQKIISLYDYKNGKVNIRFKFKKMTNGLMYFIDNIRVVELNLTFTEFVNGEVIEQSDAQSVKISPFITSQEKIYDNYDGFDIIMDFFIREDIEGSVYELAYTDSICENGIFEYPEWDTKIFAGKHVKIRSVARAKVDSTTLASKEVQVFINPQVYIQHTQNKADTYSLDAVNIFEATCTDAYGNDYPYMASEGIKFYYKEEGSTGGYTEIEAPVAKATAYTIAWNSGSLKGDYIVKATAFYKESAESTEVFNWSDSLTIRLLDGFECKITEPKAYDVEAIDFEKLLKVGGKLYHDGTVDPDTLQLWDLIYDKQNSWALILSEYYTYNLRCPKYKYLWYDTPLPWPSGTPLKNEGVKCSNAVCISPSTDRDKSTAKSVVWEDSLIWNDGYNWDYAQSFYTYPGIYKVDASVYDSKSNYPVAKADTTWIMKPSWKMKLHGNYWYNTNPEYGSTYRNKTAYAPEEDIKMYVWRPFVDRNFESTNFTISYEGTDVSSITTTADDYQTYSYDKPSYISPISHLWVMEPDTFKVSTGNPATWSRTGNEPPGFYEITAKEYDPYTGVQAVQREEIQIPPLYITAERGYEGNDWPGDLWPRGAEYEDMENEDNWIIQDFFYELPLGGKSLCSYYRTMENKALMELENQPTTITKDYNVEFKYAIGLKTIMEDYNCVFEDLLADYTIAISIDDGDYYDLKTASVSEWNEFSRDITLQDSVYYFADFTEPLHNKVSAGSSVRVKLKTQGKVFSELDNISTNIDQRVMFDEIMICYTRKECPEGPSFSKADYVSAKGYDCVDIAFNAPSGSSVAPYGYNIYRNGVKIGFTIDPGYKDFDIASETTYSYAVTAAYEGLDYPESSKLDCYFTVTTGQVVYPRPREFTLTKGGIDEYNSVFLNWDIPVGDSLSFYKVYRNDLFIAQTDTIVYTDMWLNDGEYYFSVSAVYPDDVESEKTDSLSVTITTPPKDLPLFEDFENGGISPEYWTSAVYKAYSDPDCENIWKYGTVNPKGSLTTSGEYFAYFGFEGKTVLFADDYLVSPILNLLIYKNVTISLKYLLEGDDEAYMREPGLHIRYTSEDPDTLDNGEIYWDWDHIIQLEVYDLPDGEAIFNSGWHTVTIPVYDNILTEKLAFAIHPTFRNDFNGAKQYIYLSVDSLVISGTVRADVPAGVQVSRDQGITTVSWNAVPDATMYYVYRSDKPDVGYVEIGNTPSASFTDRDTDLEDGVYFYKVVSEVTQKIFQADGGNMKNIQTKDAESIK